MYRIFCWNEIERRKEEIDLNENHTINRILQEFNYPFDIKIVICLSGEIRRSYF